MKMWIIRFLSKTSKLDQRKKVYLSNLSAMVYTMVEMAKANDLNTYKYLTYLLTQRPNEGMSDELLEQLTPWSEAAKASCQN